MKTEIEMAKRQNTAHNIKNGISSPTGRPDRPELTLRRRMIRTEVDDCIRAGLFAGDPVEFAIRMSRIAFAVAGTCAQFGCEPDNPDFGMAAKDSLEYVQRQMDGALLTGDLAEVRRAALQFEFVWYGIATSLGMPWFELLEYLTTCYEGRGQPDLAIVRRIMGIALVSEPAANDAPASTPSGGSV